MIRMKLAGFAAMALIGSAAHAVTFNFTTLNGGTEGTLATSSATVNGVTANAYTYSGGTYTASTLWLRNVTNDHGLGVCSTGEPCSTGGGDYNEISSLTNLEILRLTRPDGEIWTSLFVSSLDTGGGSSVEDGTLYYSNSALPTLASMSSVVFSYGNFGTSVEGDLFTLAAININAIKTAKYLFFKPGAPGVDNGNNDFLVWKGATATGPSEIPEPGTYALMLAGLAMLGMITRRRTKA